MLFILPILCPNCLEKIFFFQENHTCYGVADNTEQEIDYHICPFLTGKNYWETTALKLCFSFEKQTSQDLTSVHSKLDPSFYFKKATRIPKKAILVKYKIQEPYDILYFSSFDFSSFSLITKQKSNWKVGEILEIQLAKVKKKERIASKITNNTQNKKISLEKINQNIFVMEFYAKDLNLLEKAENMVLKKLNAGNTKIGKKKNKIIAIYPHGERAEFSRRIIFFLNDSIEIFFLNLVFPQGVKFSLLEKEFIFQQEQLPVVNFNKK